ncbi:hypothetical protein BLNAU_20180 [Blattamonas nauphoetae]|uniref:Uncharacterized protein n=1 Tax=Blattamonas nauphoetae TaxID=2049346 RepID=A0ABQ9X3K7_9EUKA|nr:hypothetical protein BLNAU_20180 [Blattamonas nauphoetae]
MRNESVKFVTEGWGFFVRMTFNITEPHKSSFQTIVLDDPSFTDLILNSLKLTHPTIRRNTVSAISNIVIGTLFSFTKFITYMLDPIGDNAKARFEQYRLIRVSVFEPAKHFIKFIFHNSDKLILDEEDSTRLENHLYLIHHHTKNMELESDEHDTDIVSELVKWEVRQMVEIENEENFERVFRSMLSRTHRWNRNNRDRQKRREVVLREEGWDDAFELRVVGIEALRKFRRLEKPRPSLFHSCQAAPRLIEHSSPLSHSSHVSCLRCVETGSVAIGVGGVPSYTFVHSNHLTASHPEIPLPNATFNHSSTFSDIINSFHTDHNFFNSVNNDSIPNRSSTGISSKSDDSPIFNRESEITVQSHPSLHHHFCLKKA